MAKNNKNGARRLSVILGLAVGIAAPIAFADSVLYAINNQFPNLHTVNRLTGLEETAVEMTVPGEDIRISTGLAVNPQNNEMFAAMRFESQSGSGRSLVRLNPETGVGTNIGDMGQSIASLAFADNGVLYAVTGDCQQGACGGGTIAETLYTVNQSNASLTFFKTLGNGDDGEAIAFNPKDGMMYHMSGAGAGLIFEKINLGNGAITPIPLSGDPVGPYETIGFTYDAAQDVFVGSLIDCLCNDEDRSFFKLSADGVLKHVNTLPFWWKDYAFHERPHLDLAALDSVNGNGSADAVVLVEELATAAQAPLAQATALSPGIHIFVKDGATGNAIANAKVFNGTWRAVDLAVTTNGANSLIAVLAQKNSGGIRVALHRANNGAFVRNITYFNNSWIPTALAYVPSVNGPNSSAFAVLAKNVNDKRVSVQLRSRGDGSLIGTTTFFRNIWEPVDLELIKDISGNNSPEVVVLARNNNGSVVATLRDADSSALVNKIAYLNRTVTPRGITQIANIGAGAAPELPVLAVRSNYRHVAQSRDGGTDGLASSIAFFSARWTSLDIGGLNDVNGNSSADLAVLAKHFVSRAIRAQVRDTVTGEQIRKVVFLSANWDARAFAVFDDIDGNGVQELGVAARNSNGDVRVQIKDASTGLQVTSINIP